MRKKTTVLAMLVVATLAIGGVAMAQPGPGGPGNPGAPAGPGPEPVLVEFLGLSEAQIQAWTTAFTELKATLDPLFEQQRTAQQALGTAINAATPDALTVGQAALAVKKIDDQIRAAHDGLDTKLKATLTAEQAVKYDAFRAAQRAMQGPRPGGPGPGPGSGMMSGKGMGVGMDMGHGRMSGNGAGVCPHAAK